MYTLCVTGAVKTQDFVWKFFMRYVKNKFSHSVIHNKRNIPNIYTRLTPSVHMAWTNSVTKL